MPDSEDLTEIERAGRRCAVCHSGRRWRQFEVVRPEGREAVVMCPACHARYGAAPPVGATEKVVEVAAPPPEPVAAPPEAAATPKPRSAPREDRLRKALRELPRETHSVRKIARAAGLNEEKTLSRLHALAAAGEVQQVGKRWSNEPPSTDVEAAFDRLQARTSNLRIIREREPVT
jgi:pyruvate/2-oxoglutarate dehydrogenase complex dihydrolipoamide acyltransferase (E2) component